MSHMQIVAHRYEQGLAAYRAGRTVHDMINVTNEVEKTYDDLPPEATSEQRQEIFHGAQSVMVGFLDGFLHDFRTILHSGAITRRGPSA